MIEIVYLDTVDILTSHEMGMLEFSDELGSICKSCVDKIVVEPQTHYFGEEQYPALFRKAALYWYRITTAHCFYDGNKRAGIISTNLFLQYNGYEIDIDDEMLYVYCLLIANHETRPDLDEVEAWLKRNTIKLEHYWQIARKQS